MTYHERNLLVSQPQQIHSRRRTYHNSDNHWYPSHLSSSPSQTLRIECTAEERDFSTDHSSYTIDSFSKPIHSRMTEQQQPVQFRSEIMVHNTPQTDLHIQRLRVAFHYHDDSPTNASATHHSTSTLPSPMRSQSLNIPRSSLSQRQQQIGYNSRGKHQAQSQALLHQWVDDICANEQLMANDDIVFFIKNGEFFARI